MPGVGGQGGAEDQDPGAGEQVRSSRPACRGNSGSARGVRTKPWTSRPRSRRALPICRPIRPNPKTRASPPVRSSGRAGGSNALRPGRRRHLGQALGLGQQVARHVARHPEAELAVGAGDGRPRGREGSATRWSTPAPEFWTQASRGMSWPAPAGTFHANRPSASASQWVVGDVPGVPAPDVQAGLRLPEGRDLGLVAVMDDGQSAHGSTLKAVLGVVAAAHQGAALHPPEAHGQAFPAVQLELPGLHEALQGQVQGRGGRYWPMVAMSTGTPASGP